ncbi:MAG: hypothetical protein WD031_03225, partial [Gemmatimonadota bacterium]
MEHHDDGDIGQERSGALLQIHEIAVRQLYPLLAQRLTITAPQEAAGDRLGVAARQPLRRREPSDLSHVEPISLNGGQDRGSLHVIRPS